MNRTQELIKIIDDAREELNEIYASERFDINGKWVGKYFKYYFDTGNPYTLYLRIRYQNKHGTLIGEYFKLWEDEILISKPNTELNDADRFTFSYNQMDEISKKEYDKVLRKSIKIFINHD
jgi:hypothetical protein